MEPDLILSHLVCLHLDLKEKLDQIQKFRKSRGWAFNAPIFLDELDFMYSIQERLGDIIEEYVEFN